MSCLCGGELEAGRRALLDSQLVSVVQSVSALGATDLHIGQKYQGFC